MLDFQVSDLLDAFWRIGVYSKLQRDHLLTQSKQLDCAIRERRKGTPFSSKVELVVFIKQCCDYLVTLESFNFKQAYKDWRKTEEGSIDQFYTTRWKEDVSLQSGEHTGYCTVAKVYEICSKQEYLDMTGHTDAAAIIQHTATSEQVQMFLSVLTSAETIRPVNGALARLPKCARKRTASITETVVIAKARIAAKEGRTAFEFKCDKADYEQLQSIVQSIGMLLRFSEERCIIKFMGDGESRYEDLDEASLKYIVSAAVGGKSLGVEFACIAERIAELNREELLNRFIDEVLPKLEMVNSSGEKQRVEKQIGYAGVYSKLFHRLKELGYSIEDNDFFYCVGEGA